MLDYSGVPELAQVAGLIEAELCDRDPDEECILVVAKNDL